MKNRGIILSILGIIIVSVFLVVIIKNNIREYILYDGAMLALTIDGNPSTSFPSNSNKYHVDINCDGGVGEYLPDDNYEMKFTIKNITKDGVKCFVDFTTITDNNKSEYLIGTIVQNNGTEIASTNNEGGTDISYRYTGKTPSNYVWFNNEMWRIIGLVPVCTISGCGTPTTSLVKIIRNESIGGLAYDVKDSDYTGAWGSNTLYKLLNNYYYGKSNGTGTDYCYGYYSSSYKPVPNCNYEKIGISNSETDYYGRMIENVYWNTGASSSGTANSVYTTETATQTVSGKIGLMSVSDYGYAGLDYTVGMNLSTFANSTSSNWLYGQGYEWISIQNSNYPVYALYVNNDGSVSNRVTSSARVVRPVLYLDSSIYIISGEGTENNPYILGILE